MAAWEPVIGRRVWLVPATPTAPSEAYRQPCVEIVSADAIQATVRLENKTLITTSLHNLRATPPEAPKPPAKPVDRYAIDPKHGEELELFQL